MGKIYCSSPPNGYARGPQNRDAFNLCLQVKVSPRITPGRGGDPVTAVKSDPCLKRHATGDKLAQTLFAKCVAAGSCHRP